MRRVLALRAGFLALVFSTLLGLALVGCSQGSQSTAATQERQELERLRAENQELAALRTQNEEVQRLRKENEEIPKLRAQYQTLVRLRKENEQLRTQLAKGSPPNAPQRRPAP